MPRSLADLATVLIGVGMVINAVWSVLNLKLLKAMHDEFPSKPECEGKHAVLDERHKEICRRLDQAGA